MPSPAHSLKFTLLVLAGSSLCMAQRLAETSPFLPPVRQQAAPVTENQPLELRGMMGTGESRVFSIYDPATKQSTWVKLNEQGHNFLIREHDESAQTITIDYGGRPLTLKLTEARIAAMTAPTPGPVPLPQGGPVPTGRNIQPRPPTPEQQRALEQVQAEVARRRAARAAAIQQQGQ